MTLKFAIRNLKKRPFLNLIKVAGLSLALSVMEGKKTATRNPVEGLRYE
jgi:hypothetical protein